jgi:hypothetical protein
LKRKLALIICFTGVLALSTDFVKDKTLTVFAQNKEVNARQTVVNKSVTKTVSFEEQELSEKMLYDGKDGDVKTTVTAKEQNLVENSSVKEGFVPQENGTGFFFIKVK